MFTTSTIIIKCDACHHEWERVCAAHRQHRRRWEVSKDWVHPNHTSKGGPGDPLLELPNTPLTPCVAYRVSRLNAAQAKQVYELLESFEEAPPDEKKYVSAREMNCMKCRKPGRCEVTFEYTDGGNVKSAEVTKMEDGWEYLPFGDAGGEAPYCPECQMKHAGTETGRLSSAHPNQSNGPKEGS